MRVAETRPAPLAAAPESNLRAFLPDARGFARRERRAPGTAFAMRAATRVKRRASKARDGVRALLVSTGREKPRRS
jgi:hypothetical protein